MRKGPVQASSMLRPIGEGCGSRLKGRKATPPSPRTISWIPQCEEV
jgi:hypothetical protein